MTKIRPKLNWVPSPHRFSDVSVVTLYVGPDNVKFYVHENILFDASPVFKAAFSTDFKEASERSMKLPDDDADSVERMIQWLYAKNLELTHPISVETSAECYMQLAKLNTLAEKYDIYLLHNDIVDELYDLTETPKNIKPPQMAPIKHVYENTTGDSAFRKLMVAWYAHKINFQWYEGYSARKYLADIPQDFAVDLAIELGMKHGNPTRKSAFGLSRSTYYFTPPSPVEQSDGEQVEKKSS